MKLLKKTNYPPYTVDNADDVVLRDTNGVPLIPLIYSHDFDKIESGMHTKKWRKQDINFGNAPLCGMLPLRYLYYCTNEAKIPAMTRMGYN